jgi:hypothetical protein
MATCADCFAQRLYQGFDGNKFLHAAGYLHRNTYPFPHCLSCLRFYRESGNPTLTRGLDLFLDRLFEILRINILPAYDDEILVPPCNVQLPGMDEANISRA